MAQWKSFESLSLPGPKSKRDSDSSNHSEEAQGTAQGKRQSLKRDSVGFTMSPRFHQLITKTSDQQSGHASQMLDIRALNDIDDDEEFLERALPALEDKGSWTRQGRMTIDGNNEPCKKMVMLRTYMCVCARIHTQTHTCMHNFLNR
jgi:hypothetical protein